MKYSRTTMHITSCCSYHSRSLGFLSPFAELTHKYHKETANDKDLHDVPHRCEFLFLTYTYLFTRATRRVECGWLAASRAAAEPANRSVSLGRRRPLPWRTCAIRNGVKTVGAWLRWFVVVGTAFLRK